MSHWNALSSDEIIAEWKEFRAGIDPNVALAEIADYFFDVPIGTRCIDYYSPDTWLSPWDILYFKVFCRSNVTLLMYYTLMFADVPEYEAELMLIDDFADVYLVLLINKSYVLNFELGRVSSLVDIAGDIKILEVFDNTQLKRYE